MKLGLTVIIILSIVALLAFFGISWWTQDNLDFWLSKFTNKPVHVGYFWCCVVTFVTGGTDMLFDLISQIIRAFI